MRIVYTAGVWDLLHLGHLRFLAASRALGDYLIVGVVSDDGAEAYKRRPIQDQDTRLAILRSMRCVDEAVLQETTDPSPVLRRLAADGRRPAMMTHGDDWPRLLIGHETLAELGIEWRLLPYGGGSGTTGIIRRIQNSARARGRARGVRDP